MQNQLRSYLNWIFPKDYNHQVNYGFNYEDSEYIGIKHTIKNAPSFQAKQWLDYM